MKKKIFNLSLVFVLTIAVLFSLTACGDGNEKDDEKKEDSKGSSSAESMIEEFVDAVNNHDASGMVDLMDLEGYNAMSEKDLKKKELKSNIEDFFDEYEDFEIKVKKVTFLKDDEDTLDELLDDEDYDSYEEFIEDGEDQYDLDNLDVYSAKVTVPDDFENCFVPGQKNKDMIIVRKVDGEYKIVYTMLLAGISRQKMNTNSDYSYNSTKDNTDVSKEAKEFNKKFESYEGKQTGSKVEKFIDAVITNNDKEDDHIIYISYYDENGSLDDLMIQEKEELESFKEKIKSSHSYTLEFDTDYSGYTRYVDIKY